ncbi:hypothetical protein JXO59_05730 [candidate division KSB1 bacterium]|nr:hypothetical protein [candidate division KSB1 bacterium]
MFRQGTVFTPRQLCIGLIFLTLILFPIHAQTQGILLHPPIPTAPEGKTISILARCEGITSRVRIMRIYFKAPQQTSYRFVDMQQGADNWVGQIPSRFVTKDGVQYFITALLDDQSILTFPGFNPYNQPQEITVTPAPEPAPQPVQPPIVEPEQLLPTAEEAPALLQPEPEPVTIAAVDSTALLPAPEPAADSSAQFLILSPESHEALLPDDMILAVSFFADSSELDTASLQILLDGNDVTAFASKSPALITYEPRALKKGKHWIRVHASTLKGQSVPPAAVSFEIVAREKEKKISSRIRGHAFSDLRHEQFFMQKQAVGMAGADFSGQYGALEFGGNFFITSLEDKKYQPRNRYAFHLGTRWLGINAGDVYPQMNELILWGRRVRGLSGYVHLGFFNIDGVYGEVNRAVPSVVATTQDVGGQDSSYVVQYGVFRQNLIGIRPSFGSGRRFQLGFTVVKIKDDVGSLKYGLLPKDNVVMGPDITLSFLRNRIRFEAAVAFSLLTNNIYPGSTKKEELEDVFGSVDLPIDPKDIDSWLIINDSTTPLNPLELTSLAYRFQVRVNYFNNLITVGYKSIGPQYISLGNPWLRTDIQGLFFSDRVRLWQNRVYLSFGYEGMADNYSRQDDETVLDLRTLNYALTLYPGNKWPTVNINMRDHYRNNHLRSIYYDTLQVSDGPDFIPDTSYIARDSRERQLFRDFSVQASQNFNLLNLRHQIFLTYILSKNIDQFKATRLPGTLPQEMSNTIAMFSLTTNYRFPLKTTLSLAANQNKISLNQTVSYNSISLGGEYKIMGNRLTCYGEARYTMINNWMNAVKTGMNRAQIRLGANWQLASSHSLIADVNMMRNSGDIISANGKSSYDDILLRLRYDKYF